MLTRPDCTLYHESQSLLHHVALSRIFRKGSSGRGPVRMHAKLSIQLPAILSFMLSPVVLLHSSVTLLRQLRHAEFGYLVNLFD